MSEYYLLLQGPAKERYMEKLRLLGFTVMIHTVNPTRPSLPTTRRCGPQSNLRIFRYKARPTHARTTSSLETTGCIQLLSERVCENHPSLASTLVL